MKKWANYLISKVRYDSKNLISTVTRHQDTDLGITPGEYVDRLTIVSDIKNGLSYMTIYNGKNSWKKGHKIQTFSIRGITYLRIDGNKVKLDYLGDLPELLLVKSNSVLKSTSGSITQTEIKPLSTSKGSLPKESADELPQELELVPEIETEEDTSEQLERIDYLQKQIQRLETIQQIKPLSTSKGSLPKESADELPQELELVPEIEPETIIHSKMSVIQLAQLDDLQRQVDNLQNILSNSFSFKSESVEKIIPKQFSKIMKSKNQLNKLESVGLEYDLIQILQKQNKKLDYIEKKLHDLEKIK